MASHKQLLFGLMENALRISVLQTICSVIESQLSSIQLEG